MVARPLKMNAWRWGRVGAHRPLLIVRIMAPEVNSIPWIENVRPEQKNVRNNVVPTIVHKNCNCDECKCLSFAPSLESDPGALCSNCRFGIHMKPRLCENIIDGRVCGLRKIDHVTTGQPAPDPLLAPQCATFRSGG